jgi:geranylgeranyl pyrophosphate synthase
MSQNKERFYTTKTALEIIRMKTVSFMTYAAKIGAMVGQATEEQSEVLMKYAEKIGYSFQIRDDILDIIATQNGMGKTVLSDLKGGRSNFILAHALESIPSEKKRELVMQIDNGNVDLALARIGEMKSIEYSTEIARSYMEAAKDIIRGFGFFNEDLLLLFADFAMNRIY